MNSTDEYVMDSIVTFDKVSIPQSYSNESHHTLVSLIQMKVLIYDLLCTEVWKAKLHPLLKNQLG